MFRVCAGPVDLSSHDDDAVKESSIESQGFRRYGSHGVDGASSVQRRDCRFDQVQVSRPDCWGGSRFVASDSQQQVEDSSRGCPSCAHASPSPLAFDERYASCDELPYASRSPESHV